MPGPPDLLEALQAGLGVLIAVALLALLLTPRRAFDRALMALATTPPILIYLHWRYTRTLPAYDLAFEPIWARLFFTFEALSIVYSLGAVLITLRHSETRVQADAAEAALAASGNWPAVDVMIRAYNEPLAVLEKSILAALSLDYLADRVTIWVLDDTCR